MEQFASTTNLSTISSAIPLALVPSVSTPLPFIADSLIIWLNVTIIIHQVMILTVQVCIFSSCICPKLTCCSRPCVGIGLLYCTLLATWNRVCRLLSQVGHFCQPLIPVILWWPRVLSISWGYSIRYAATTGRCWLLQVSDSRSDVVGTYWFIGWSCFRYLGDSPNVTPNVIPHYIWAHPSRILW